MMDLTPLVRCLPVEAWIDEPSFTSPQDYSITRSLRKTEWDTLRRYMRRIRILRSVGFLDMEIIQTLSYPPTPESLFPNLQQLSWDDERPESLPFIYQLVGPQTTKLVISCWPTDWTEEEWYTLSSLPSCCPGITDISLHLPFTIEGQRTLSDMLCSWSNLRTVICPAVNENAIIHLANLQKLKSLEFDLRSKLLPEPSQCLPFKSLRKLSLKSMNLTDVTNLMLGLCVSLEELRVQVSRRVARDTLRSYFTAVEKSCQHDRLSTVWLYLDTPASMVQLGDFASLRCFGNLTTIIIETHSPIECDGRVLLCLASAWPKLEVLSLNNDTGWRTSLGATPKYLARLVQKCTLLKNLSIVLNTTGFTTIPAERPSRGFVNLVEFDLNVLDSVIEAECVTPMAAFLSDLFPKLRMQSLVAFQDVYSQRWKAVETQTQQIAGVREQERRWKWAHQE